MKLKNPKELFNTNFKLKGPIDEFDL